MGKKRPPSDSPQLFREQFVPAEVGSGKLFDVEYTGQDQPVTCLGMTFANDEARRKYFTEQLREKLKDPEFRKIEGFPIGEDEDILNLSDPPFYTACPNPWIADFIAEWKAEKPEHPDVYHYHREPFAADVSEGKYDPVYRMHPYHTKVPHKAIMRYILHYTQPGDIVFDGFCGTGMTGVAARMCGEQAEVSALGYRVNSDGTILHEQVDENGKMVWLPFSKLGARKSVLNDISPAATYISSSYNTPANTESLKSTIHKIIDTVEEKWGWLYETRHTNGENGKINSVIWSDVFVCPECSADIVFWENAVDIENGEVLEKFECAKCGASLTKRNIERRWTTSFDPLLGKSVTQAKQVPVRINYVFGGKKYDKPASADDLELLEIIASRIHNVEQPVTKISEGDKTGEPLRIGFTHVHHLYSTRNYIALSEFKNLCKDSRLWLPLTIVAFRITKRYGLTYQSGTWGAGGGPQNGTYYIPSLIKELNILRMLRDAVDKILAHSHHVRTCITTQSSSKVAIPDDTLDYVFIDPPFGSNLNYSELNLVWESWLGAKTNIREEAIENKSQKKGSAEYRDLMTRCFQEVYRILAPGRWMTIEFSNTKASVWNNIQASITDAGFVIANVSALDKKKGSFNAQTNPTSVKQDLVISAYKPNGGFEERFQTKAQTEDGVWDFVRTHLNYLPVIKQQGAVLQFVPERDPRILFDQMVAYYVRKGFPVPISSQEFQIGLAQRFIERDGMYFLPDQVAEYDRKKASSGYIQQASLFVSDESSAIQWLRQLIKDKPQTFSDINPQFMQQLGGWSKNEAHLDLRELLNQNFLCYDGKGPVPEQIHAYLSSNWKELRNLPKDDFALVAKASDRWYVPDPNKAGDLEKLREKALLKEFEEYKTAKKKLKVFRLEAVRAGFKKAWQERDYPTIVSIADKIPNNVLEEDPKLLMWYDQAVTRLGE